MADINVEKDPSAHGARGLTRRQALKLGSLGVTVAGTAAALGVVPASAATTRPLDYTSPETFDAFYNSFVASGRLGQATDYNDVLGGLAWGQTYVQQGLLRVYQAYGRRYHLDRLLADIDNVLATRDSERGVTEYRGLSLPAWRAGYPYTAGAVSVPDASGRPVLQVRSVNKPIETLKSYTGQTMDLVPQLHVEVTAAATPGAFDLKVWHDGSGAVDELKNLTMDTVVDRVTKAWPTHNLLTVKDLRAGNPAGPPAPGSFTMSSQQGVFPVHTGMITYPIAWAARLILESPSLRDDPLLRQKAEYYISCCRAAVAVHDEDWRENAAGEGWYVCTKGAPVDLDGSELPANQFLAVARTLIHLAAVTGDATYTDRAAKMARTFRNQLTLGANGAYTWHYWPTWGHIYNGYEVADGISDYRLSWCCARQIEDISHAHIDVDLAIEAYRNNIVFNETDMRRLAATFTRNVATTSPSGSPSAWSNVDGSGVRGNLTFDELSALWMPTASFDRAIFDHVNATFTADAPSYETGLSGFHILAVGNLAWFQGITASGANAQVSNS